MVVLQLTMHAIYGLRVAALPTMQTSTCLMAAAC
jgi:hypothetical protein